MKVPKQFWGEAVLTASYLINRMPTRVLKYETPINILKNSYPTSHHLFSSLTPRTFGCIVFVHIHSQHRSKLDPRAHKCIFLGYSPTQKGYKCYHPSTHKYFVSRDVTFFEHQSYPWENSLKGERSKEENFWEIFHEPVAEIFHEPVADSTFHEVRSEIKGSKDMGINGNEDKEDESRERGDVIVYSRRRRRSLPPLENLAQSSTPIMDPGNIDSQSQTSQGNSTPTPTFIDLDIPIALRKPVRTCTQHPIAKFVSYGKLNNSFRAFTANLSCTSIPNNVQEALDIPEWKNAVFEEMRALHKNKTWEIIDLPTTKRPVGCKWVFTLKFNTDGSIERHKARLVAKGYTQTFGIDYQETFAPVAKMNTVRILLSLAARFEWSLQQLDVKNAFLHEDLKEEVYMELPPSFEEQLRKGKVCKLKKSLYRLK